MSDRQFTTLPVVIGFAFMADAGWSCIRRESTLEITLGVIALMMCSLGAWYMLKDINRWVKTTRLRSLINNKSKGGHNEKTG